MQDFEKLFPIAPCGQFLSRIYQAPECAEVAALYASHITRMHSLSLMPGHAFMDGEKWHEFCTQASRELKSSDPNNARIEMRARRLYDKWRQDDAPQKQTHFIEASMNTAKMWNGIWPMHNAHFDLVQTMIVQAWTAFEIITDHLYRAVKKTRPRLYAELSNKKKKAIGFSSRRKIRDSYAILIQPEDEAIRDVLKNSAIDALALVRCLIVHAGGKVDDWFIDDSEDVAEVAHYRGLPEGTQIEIPCSYARKLIDDVTPLGFDLISEVDRWILAQP